MKQSNRRRIGGEKSKLPYLLFTLHELVVLKKALTIFEKRMLLTTKPLPNLQLALETVKQVQTKITAMMRFASYDDEEQCKFDANEVLLMETAVRLFTIWLHITSPSLERAALLIHCQMLSQKLSDGKKQSHSKI